MTKQLTTPALVFSLLASILIQFSTLFFSTLLFPTPTYANTQTCFSRFGGGGISINAITDVPSSLEAESRDLIIEVIFTPLNDPDYWAESARDYKIKSTSDDGNTVEQAVSRAPENIGDGKYKLSFVLAKEDFLKKGSAGQSVYSMFLITPGTTPPRDDCFVDSYIVTDQSTQCSSTTVNKCGAFAGCAEQETCVVQNNVEEGFTEYVCKKLQNECGGVLECGTTSSSPSNTCGCAGSPFEDIGGGIKCCGWIIDGACTSTQLGNYEKCGTITPHGNATRCSLPSTIGGAPKVEQSGFSQCTSNPRTCCTEKALCEDSPNTCGNIKISPTGHQTCEIGGQSFDLGTSAGLQRCGDLLVCCASAGACQSQIDQVDENTGGGNTENSETGSLLDAIKGPTNETFNALNPLNIAAGRPGESARSPYFAALQTPGGIISRLLLFAFPIAGMILFIMIVWGGFEMVTGATNAKSMDAGKQRITAAIIGFVLLFVSYWLMQIIEVVFGLAIL